MVEHCDKSNLVIKPRRGTALFWYNHLLDNANRWIGNLDPLSYQGSCSVKKGEKWVAKIWININGDGKRELRAWKMGHNWLASNNYNKEITYALQAEITDKVATENKYTRDKNDSENKQLDDNHKFLSNKEKSSKKEELASTGGTVESNERLVRCGDVTNEETSVEIIDDSQEVAPKGPKLTRTETSSPLPLTEEQMTPKGPSVGQLPPQNFAGNRIMQSIMLLLEELDQVELEIIARNLHTKLKLVCVPLIVNPMGRL